MSLAPDFIETCQGQRFLIVDPFYTTPLLETGLEIAETLSERNSVTYVGPDALCCVTDEAFHSRARAWINLSRKRNASKHLSDKVKTYRRSEIQFIKQRLDAPDPRAFIDLSAPDLGATKFDNFDVGMGLISSLVSLTRDPNVDLMHHQDFVMSLARDAIMLYRLTEELVRTDACDTVIMFNGRQAPVRAIRRAADAMGVRYITYERGSSRDKYALFDRSTPHHPDGFREWADLWWTVVDDPEARARDYLAGRRSGRPQEWYSFTSRQEVGFSPRRDGRKRITFFTSSEDELVAVGDELRPDSPLCDQAHAIRSVGLACRERGHEYIVRFHPNTAPSELALFGAAHDAGAILLEPSSKVDTYALVDSSDIVFTHSSTVGLEAACAGKSVFYVGRNYFEKCHSVRRIKQDDEISGALDVPYITDPHDALKYANYFASHGIPYQYYAPRGFFSGLYRGRDLNGPIFSALRNAKLYFTRGGI